jgi:glycosyltransferase involved in cell wall biosynthesis
MTSEVTERRRILILISQLGYAGAESDIVRLADFLSEFHNVTMALFTRHYGGAYIQAGSTPKCRLALLDEEGPKPSVVRRWWIRWRKLRALKKENDACISFLSGPNLLNALTGNDAAKILFVAGSVHYATETSLFPRIFYSTILNPIAYRLSDAIVPIASWLSSEIVAFSGSNVLSKIIPIPGLRDTSELLEATEKEVDPRYEPLRSKRLIVACGRLSRQKGFEYLIPIFAEVRLSVPEAVLMIIGDGPEAEKLLNLAVSLNLKVAGPRDDPADANIIFTGYQANPSRYFRLARVFVMSSVHEGLPNVLIEVLASGVPCLVSEWPWPGAVRAMLSAQEPVSSMNRFVDDPQRVDFGTVMPSISQQENKSYWVHEIVSALSSESSVGASVDTRRGAVARFDLQRNGVIWLKLIDDVCRKRALS